MTAKELLAKVKALFDAAPGAAPAPGDIAPADTGATGTVYTLADGTTQISIVQAGTTPAVGDMVTVAGVPPAAGILTLLDGSSMTVDATGAITAYTAAAPITVDPLDAAKPAAPAPAPAPAVPAAPAPPKQFEITKENIATMFAAFATGSSDDRIANLELVCKALMDSCFGWQIREAQQKATADQAIIIYKQDLVQAQAAMAKQDEKIKGMFELMETMVQLPTAEPKTLTGAKKDQFVKAESREKKLEGFAAAIKKNKAEAAGK